MVKTGILNFHLLSVEPCHSTSFSVYDKYSPEALYPPLDLDRMNPSEPKAAELGPEEKLGPPGYGTVLLANEEQGWRE